MIFLTLAWRNLLKNYKRTVISVLTISLGIAALIFTDAIMIGMKDNMISVATSSWIGEAQIHHSEYRVSQDPAFTINDLSDVTAELDKDTTVSRYSYRTISYGMLSSPTNVSAVSIVGIDPEIEQHLSYFDDTMIEGSYFEGNNQRDIIIGTKLAELLNVEYGDKIVATVAALDNGETSQEMFRISGIFDFGERAVNAGFALIRIEKSREMLGIGEEAHEIAVVFHDLHAAEDESSAFWSKYSKNNNEAVSWTKIIPQLVSAFEMSNISMTIMTSILFAITIFVIWNSLFMSLFERMFEFGVMRALGTRSFALAKMVIYEAALMGIFSVILGIILGYILNSLVAINGLNYTDTEFLGVTIRENIKPTLRLFQFLFYPALVFVFTVVVSLYPARYAVKIEPANAMRKSF